MGIWPIRTLYVAMMVLWMVLFELCVSRGGGEVPSMVFALKVSSVVLV